jgi:hypothetical protein
MIDRDTAQRIAAEEIARMKPPEGDQITLDDAATIERPFGWVFFYTSRRYEQTKEVSNMLFGNAPFIVDRRDGSVHYTGTGRPVERYIAEYESKRDSPA